MVDPGPVITPPGQYTHCVDRKDYQDVPGVLDAGIPAIVEFLLCNYLLGGKLVCLAGGDDGCAIGTVVGLEAVGEGKTGINALDNDFSFNVLLAPYEAQDIAKAYGPPSSPLAPPNGVYVDPHIVRDDLVSNGPLGWLMVDSPNPQPLPAPVDQSGAPGPPIGKPQPQEGATWRIDGYGVLWKLDSDVLAPSPRPGVQGQPDTEEGDNLHKLWRKPPNNEWPPPPDTGVWLPLPVLHCECEGSRIFFVCQAMKPFLDLMQASSPAAVPARARRVTPSPTGSRGRSTRSSMPSAVSSRT